MRNHILAPVVTLLSMLMVSCGQEGSIEITEAPVERVCELQENLTILDNINGLTIVNGDLFVVNTESQVILYGMDGRQIRTIGHSGRAKYEYSYPLFAASYDDIIYVWSANSLRFISFNINGEPIEEYPYDSAIQDFIVVPGHIIIYCTGVNEQNVIDIYDLESCSVEKSLYPSSPEHCADIWVSDTPLCYSDNAVFFTPKDEITIMRYDIGNGELSAYGSVESDSFSVSRLSKSEENALSDWRKKSEFSKNNSRSVSLTKKGKDFLLLTKEGKADNQLYSLYSLNQKGQSSKIGTYTYESFGYANTIDCFNGDIYNILIDTQGGAEAHFYLNRLVR